MFARFLSMDTYVFCRSGTTSNIEAPICARYLKYYTDGKQLAASLEELDKIMSDIVKQRLEEKDGTLLLRSSFSF